VALVSPIFAAYSAVTVLLAFVVAGELLSATALAGVAVTLAGVVMASMTGTPEPGATDARRGVPFAIASMIGWGIASYITGRYAQRLDWYYPVVVTRVVEIVIVVVVALVVKGLGRDRGRTRGPFRWRYGIPALAGVLDIVALLAYSRGSQLGLVSVVSAASASFPLIVVAGGIVVFHERPRPIQWVGVAATIGGLILLGVGQ
jgi:drug/metabolite transporter (DMT)-like permease